VWRAGAAREAAARRTSSMSEAGRCGAGLRCGVYSGVEGGSAMRRRRSSGVERMMGGVWPCAVQRPLEHLEHLECRL
jgi:hypothetical protein